MSVFLKPGVLKVKDDQGNYSGINILAEQSTAQCLEDIEDKGQEVLDSIPEDYTEVLGEISDLRADIEQIEPGLSDNAKVALLNCFAHVAWVDEHGQDYYDALEDALYADIYPKITAQFNPGTNVVYTDDTLDSLKQYLTVKYFETKDSAGTVIPSNGYALSGTLTAGSSTIFATYNGLSTMVIISGVVDFYDIWSWSIEDGNLEKVAASADPNQSDTTLYPSRTTINFANAYRRRTFSVLHGKTPFYEYDKTGVSTIYYPIPVPRNANHVKITMEPTGQYIFMHTVPYDPVNNYYLDSFLDNRIMWTQLTDGSVEKDLVGYGDMQLFIIINAKYDSAGTSYPVEPTNMTIEFSEV